MNRAQFRAALDEINAKAAGGLQGLAVDRPAATALLERFIYKATDTGKYFWCDGVGWAEIGGAELADAAPPAIGDAGVLGASVQAAREDHTHALHPQTALLNRAQTFTEDQTFETGNVLRLGDGGTFGQLGPGGGPEWFYNVRWDGANYVRLLADNEAGRLLLGNNGDLVYYTNTDALDTVGSVITWGERWRITKAGLMTGTQAGGVSTADQQVVNSTAIQLGGPVFTHPGGDQTWLAEWLVFYTADAAGDLNIQMASSSGTESYTRYEVAGHGYNESDVLSLRRVGYNSPLSFGGAGATIRVAKLELVLATASVNSSVHLRFSQRVASATPTIILAGTAMKARRLA